MSVALLIIDMQVGCREDCRYQAEFDQAVEYINETARLFRAKGLPVVVVQDIEVSGGPGHDGFAVVPSINRSETDIVIHKEYNNAFWQTNLAEVLKDKGVDFIVVSGFAAEYCVLFTYNGAVEQGFGASLLQHGVAGVNADEIKRIQLLRPVISIQALEHFIQ